MIFVFGSGLQLGGLFAAALDQECFVVLVTCSCYRWGRRVERSSLGAVGAISIDDDAVMSPSASRQLTERVVSGFFGESGGVVGFICGCCGLGVFGCSGDLLVLPFGLGV